MINGFYEQDSIKQPILLSSVKEYDWEYYNNDILLDNLLYNIIKDIKKTNLYRLDTFKDIKNGYPINMAKLSLSLTPLNFSNCIVKDKFFRIQDKEFNEQEIKEALINTFPERFLI